MAPFLEWNWNLTGTLERSSKWPNLNSGRNGIDNFSCHIVLWASSPKACVSVSGLFIDWALLCSRPIEHIYAEACYNQAEHGQDPGHIQACCYPYINAIDAHMICYY